MADANPPGRLRRISDSLNTGIGLGILFIIMMLIAFWVVFIKPLEFAGKAAMNGLSSTGQSSMVLEKFDVTINAKGEAMIVGNDPQKILETLKEAKPTPVPAAGSKPAP
ncbi:hypothetical protein HYV70_01245 [Candidatus Uhrbacteria bacterium]|nr:hypothetical protein [Candidatus Uhrbacteria bacterium]